MLRLKTNKTKLYNLVSGYEKLPTMRKTTFWKSLNVPDYWLEWNENGLKCSAFLASCGGRPLLAIEKKESFGQETSRVVHKLELKDLQARGMIEEFVTAAERRFAKNREADGQCN